MEATTYKSLPSQGAETEKVLPPEDAAVRTVKTVTVDGYPAGPTAVAWPAQGTSCTRLERIFAAASSYQKTFLLALRVFATATSMISFIVAAVVGSGAGASRDFLIAAMVILFAGNFAYLVHIALQMLGVQVKAKIKLACGMRKLHLDSLICGVAACLELIVLLLAFGSCTAFATGLSQCGYYDFDCAKSKAAVAMGFLASIAQLAIISASGGWTCKSPTMDLKPIKPESIKLGPDYV